MTDIKILLENFKKYSLKQEERRYDFERDEEVASDMIDKMGFKHVDVSYEEGYEDDRHSEQDFDEYITDTSTPGAVNARIFIPVSEEKSFVVPQGFFKDSIKPKEMELRKALIDKYGSDDMRTYGYGITPEFVSNNKANSRNFKENSIAGVEIKLVGVEFDLSFDEEHSKKQLEKYLNFYKDIDNSFEQIKSDVLKSVAELKVKAEQFE